MNKSPFPCSYKDIHKSFSALNMTEMALDTSMAYMYELSRTHVPTGTASEYLCLFFLLTVLTLRNPTFSCNNAC